jgi:hypothetical protein
MDLSPFLSSLPTNSAGGDETLKGNRVLIQISFKENTKTEQKNDNFLFFPDAVNDFCNKVSKNKKSYPLSPRDFNIVLRTFNEDYNTRMKNGKRNEYMEVIELTYQFIEALYPRKINEHTEDMKETHRLMMDFLSKFYLAEIEATIKNGKIFPKEKEKESLKIQNKLLDKLEEICNKHPFRNTWKMVHHCRSILRIS